MKRSLILLLVGMLLGIALGSAFGPKLITYWYTPPITNSVFNCKPEIEWAMGRLIETQLVGAAALGVSVTIGGFLIARSLRRRAAAKSAAIAAKPSFSATVPQSPSSSSQDSKAGPSDV